MKKVYLCSPLRGDHEKNLQNARYYCREAANAGVLPFAPHVYFTQFLDDAVSIEREAGMRLGIEWLKICDEVWVYGEISEGMLRELEAAEELGIPINYRI